MFIFHFQKISHTRIETKETTHSHITHNSFSQHDGMWRKPSEEERGWKKKVGGEGRGGREKEVGVLFICRSLCVCVCCNHVLENWSELTEAFPSSHLLNIQYSVLWIVSELPHDGLKSWKKSAVYSLCNCKWLNFLIIQLRSPTEIQCEIQCEVWGWTPTVCVSNYVKDGPYCMRLSSMASDVRVEGPPVRSPSLVSALQFCTWGLA